jgi:hypothetical protein
MRHYENFVTLFTHATLTWRGQPFYSTFQMGMGKNDLNIYLFPLLILQMGMGILCQLVITSFTPFWVINVPTIMLFFIFPIFIALSKMFLNIG